MMNKIFLRVCVLLLLLSAFSAFSESLDESQQQGERFFEQAQALNKQGKYREAVEMYEKSLAAERKSPKFRQSKLGLYLNQAAAITVSDVNSIQGAVMNQNALRLWWRCEYSSTLVEKSDSYHPLKGIRSMFRHWYRFHASNYQPCNDLQRNPN